MAEKKKVLIIDDERDYADILKQRLEFEGFDVCVAYDGAAGLKVAKEESPDVVLLDIMMPELDGFETAKQFHSAFPFNAMQIIFVTAYGRDPSEIQLKIIGDSKFIRKPFEIADLIALIHKMLA
ncbi:MAG TPA: response regulator [bacterium]|nr:response regulator [bacterium]